MSKSKQVAQKTTAPAILETPVVETEQPQTETQIPLDDVVDPVEEKEDALENDPITKPEEPTETEMPIAEEPTETEMPIAKEPAPVQKAPEVEVPAAEVPRARNAKYKKGLVRANVNVNIPTAPVFSLDGIVKHKHNFDLANVDGQLKEVIDFLNSYEERMNPNINIDEMVGESLQKQLFKNYIKILGLPALERGVGLEVLLWKFFENNNQVWRVNNLSRYTRNGKWNIAELQMFVQLSNLFNLIKDPSERIARVRTIKLGATVAKFPGEKAKYTEALIAWATSLK